MNKQNVYENKLPAIITLSTFLLLIFTSYYLTVYDSRISDIRQSSLEFNSNTFIPTDELDTISVSEIKLSHILQMKIPQAGVFGHHVVNRFTATPFKNLSLNKTFFNYHFRHISMEEQLQLLLFLEKKNLLPNEYIFVYLSHPVLGRHHYFANTLNLPDYVYTRDFSKTGKTTYEELIENKSENNAFVKYRNKISSSINNYVDKHLDWKNVIHAIGVVIFKDCINLNEDRLDASKLDILKSDICNIRKKEIERGWYNDGSALAPKSPMPDMIRDTRNTVFRTETDWKPDDHVKIRELLNSINNIGVRNNVKIIFFMPPTFEKLHNGISNRIIDKALESPGNLVIFDDRNKNHNKNIYYDPDHPGDYYYESIIKRAGVVN